MIKIQRPQVNQEQLEISHSGYARNLTVFDNGFGISYASESKGGKGVVEATGINTVSFVRKAK